VKNVHGKWIEAKPIKGAILLNCGQLMELWTGGQLQAAVSKKNRKYFEFEKLS
jgi:isopenicillin N synthase-like dioxygenase